MSAQSGFRYGPSDRVSWWRSPLLRRIALACIGLPSIDSVAWAQFVATDIFIADQQYVSLVSRASSGAVFLFDVSAGGVRRLLSDFGDARQGPLGSGSPQGVTGIVVETRETLLVTDRGGGTNGAGQLFRINASGLRTVVTDFGDAAQGPVAVQPTGVALDAAGRVLVGTLQVGGVKPLGALFRIDRNTGQRTLLSDGNDPTRGPVANFYGLAVEAGGHILAVDVIRGTGNRGVLMRIDPTTGQRTVLSDFGQLAQGTLGQNPSGIAVEESGSILVICRRGGAIGAAVGVLFRVDPSSGNRTMVTDFSDPDPLKGPVGMTPSGVAVDPLGNILVVDIASSQNNFSGSLFKVNPVTGLRERYDDFGAPLVGEPLGQTPSGVVAMQVCGDGRPDRLEDCDDGNTMSGDGCSSQCKVEPGFFACAKRIATIVGTDGKDELVGTKEGDVIHGRGGNDRIFGNAGRDLLCGGDGNDLIRGGSSNDIIDGGAGNDILIGDNGKDTIRGQDGDDLMRGGENSDTCDGGRHLSADTALHCERVLNVP